MNLDNKILNSAFAIYSNHPQLQSLFLFLASDLIYILVILVLVFWFVRTNREFIRKGLVEAFICFVIARGMLTTLIRDFFPRERPHVADHLFYFTAAKASEPSFPSGHASAMFAIAMTLYFYNRKLGLTLLILSVLTGIFRVVVGYHYPSDIVGGAVLGIIVAFLTHAYLQKFSGALSKNVSIWSDKLLPFTK